MQFEKSYLDPIKTALDVLGWNHEKVGNLESFFSIDENFLFNVEKDVLESIQ